MLILFSRMGFTTLSGNLIPVNGEPVIPNC